VAASCLRISQTRPARSSHARASVARRHLHPGASGDPRNGVRSFGQEMELGDSLFFYPKKKCNKRSWNTCAAMKVPRARRAHSHLDERAGRVYRIRHARSRHRVALAAKALSTLALPNCPTQMAAATTLATPHNRRARRKASSPGAGVIAGPPPTFFSSHSSPNPLFSSSPSNCSSSSLPSNHRRCCSHRNHW
jgi:hypothetical protein